MVQFIEGQDCQHLHGQQVTVQARVQCSAAATIKIGVLQWAGTEDQPTNDPVSSWAATPTWAASYSLAGSGSVALAASTWSDLRATFTLNSSFSNLAIIVWGSDVLAQNATLDLSAMQIERGATATPFEVRPVGAELALCQRYYEEIGGQDIFHYYGFGWVNNSTTVRILVAFMTTKRAIPSVSVSAAGDFQIIEIGLTNADSSVFLSPTPINALLQLGATGASFTSGNIAGARANGTLDARVIADAEL
jgi:hypothetical protein